MVYIEQDRKNRCLFVNVNVSQRIRNVTFSSGNMRYSTKMIIEVRILLEIIYEWIHTCRQ